MSDEEVKRGVRAMVSGGMESLDDDAIAQLGKAVNKTQRDRGLAASDEVLYLQEYVKLSEEYIILGVNTGSFYSTGINEKLNALNEKFPNINENVRKKTIMCPDIGDRLSNDGWMSSSYEC